MITPVQIYSFSKKKHNIELLNAGDVITSKSDLSTAFNGAFIHNYQVVGNSIKCRVDKRFTISNNAFENSTITDFIDDDNFCYHVGNGSFKNSSIENFVSYNIELFGWGAFENCTALLEIKSNYAGVIINGWAFRNTNCNFNMSIRNSRTDSFKNARGISNTLTFFSSFTAVDDGTFADSSITTFINSNVVLINNGGFSGSDLQEFNCPSLINLAGYGSHFSNCTQLHSFYAQELLATTESGSIWNYNNWRNCTNLTTLYVPKFRKNQKNNEVTNIFQNINPACTITIDSSMQTANGGMPDADVQYAINRGCTIVYVTNP